MSFITQVTISIVIYFITRICLKGTSSLNVASSVAGLSYAMMYLYSYDFLNVLPTIHFMVTGFSLIFIFISYNEIIILERMVRKIKKGELVSNEPFSVEKSYKIVFKLLGLGLVFLSLALISGFSMQSVFTANIIFKSIFTIIAWVIYVITLIGIKFFNFPIKYATRSLFIAMWAVLGAYFMNSYLAGS